MAMHPEVQAKAQAELDNHLGLARLPELEDREHLPYCVATLMEVLRWRPATPLGVPHRLMVDDYYDGYFLPAGSLVVAVRISSSFVDDLTSTSSRMSGTHITNYASSTMVWITSTGPCFTTLGSIPTRMSSILAVS